MAWVATEDFTGYTDAVDLADQGSPGGTGWSGGWLDNSIGHWVAETAPSGMSGMVAAGGANTANSLAWRVLATPASSGIVQWKMRIDNAAPNDNMGVILEDGNDPGNRGRCYCRFGPTGNIELYNNTGGYQSIGAYSINTVYTIAMEFDAATDQYRASIDGGAFSDWKTANTGALGNVTLVRLDASHSSVSPGARIWVDDIQPYSPVVVAAPKLYVTRGPIRSN